MKMFLAVIAIFILLPTAIAFAQTTPDTVVQVNDLLAPWLQLLLAAASVIVPALTAWIAAEFRKRTGIAVQQAHMKTFQSAVLNAAGLFLTEVGRSTQGISFDARHPAMKKAILAVNASAPDALEYFGLTPQQIAEKIMAKVGILTAAEPEIVNVTHTGGPHDPLDRLVGRIPG